MSSEASVAAEMRGGRRPYRRPGPSAVCGTWPTMLGRERSLAVRPEQVGSGDWGLVAEGCVSASMVVVPEPAVKCSAAFAAGSVDRAVGPAVEQGADEALGFPVGLRSARPCAGVVDAEPSAGERVAGRTVGGAVVGEDALDLDAVAGKEDDGAVEKAGRGRGPFVGEDFGVGETAVVVDGDVDVVPAAGAAVM